MVFKKVYIFYILYYSYVFSKIADETNPNVYKLTTLTNSDYMPPSTLNITDSEANIKPQIMDWSFYLSNRLFNIMYGEHITYNDKKSLDNVFGYSAFLPMIILKNIKKNNKVRHIFATGGIDFDYLREKKYTYYLIKNYLERYSKKKNQIYNKWEKEFRDAENRIKKDNIAIKDNIKINEDDIQFSAVGGLEEKLRNIFIFIEEKKLDNNALFLAKSQKNYNVTQLIDNLNNKKEFFKTFDYNKIKNLDKNNALPHIKKLAIDEINNKYNKIIYTFFLTEKINTYIKNPKLISLLYGTEENLKDKMIFDFKDTYNETKIKLELDIDKLINILQNANYVENIEDIKKHNENSKLTKIFHYKDIPKMAPPTIIEHNFIQKNLNLVENLQSYQEYFPDNRPLQNEAALKKELIDRIYQHINNDIYEEHANKNPFI